MNPVELQQSAIILEGLLRQYAQSRSAAKELLSALSDLLSEAAAGRLTKPLDWRLVPGSVQFSEGGLSEYGDLEAAYARFKIELTGGASATLRALRDSPEDFKRGLSFPAP